MENLQPFTQLTNCKQLTSRKYLPLFASSLGKKLLLITKQFAFYLHSSMPFIIWEYNLMRCRTDIGPGSLQHATSVFPFKSNMEIEH